MRKIILLLSLLIFLGCLVAGISLAKQIPGLDVEEANGTAIQRTRSPYQHNILIVHVDNLQNPTPQLISMWGLIIYFPEPKIILQPLYPLNREANQTLGQQFALTQSKNIHPKFVNAVAQSTQIDWNNFILLDHDAFSTITTTILKDTELITLDPQATVLQVEYQHYFQACQTFANKGKDVFQSINWQSLIPDHLRTNLAMDDVLVNWQKLTTNEQPIRCDVFSE